MNYFEKKSDSVIVSLLILETYYVIETHVLIGSSHMCSHVLGPCRARDCTPDMKWFDPGCYTVAYALAPNKTYGISNHDDM